MVDMKYVALIGAVTALGGYYYAFVKAGSKMCTDANFGTQMTTYQAQCPTINALDLMKYYTF